MSQADVRNRPGYQVKRAQQALHQACERQLRPLGISMSKYAVLLALADEPGISSAALARRCFVTRQSLQDVLGGLRSAGLVAVAEQAGTGRARPVTLTDEGARLLREADRAIVEVENRMLAGIDRADRRRLVELLTTCAENLNED
ncbi:MarR family winged helix-turn-helix transcriptional regulator [Saccharopolyspora taberi]|uniref:MarR family transcriptional regulator n=1 Tax=Saccharopolyspora taberi TaxID=60895 RepID=A0ABN3VDM0_9PSEU